MLAIHKFIKYPSKPHSVFEQKPTYLFIVNDAVFFVSTLDSGEFHHKVHEVGTTFLTLWRKSTFTPIVTG